MCSHQIEDITLMLNINK